MNLDFRSEQALAGARQFQQAQKIRKAQHPESSVQHSPAEIEPAEFEPADVLIAASPATSSRAA